MQGRNQSTLLLNCFYPFIHSHISRDFLGFVAGSLNFTQTNLAILLSWLPHTSTTSKGTQLQALLFSMSWAPLVPSFLSEFLLCPSHSSLLSLSSCCSSIHSRDDLFSFQTAQDCLSPLACRCFLSCLSSIFCNTENKQLQR